MMRASPLVRNRRADSLWKSRREISPPDGGDCERVLADFAKAGIDIGGLAKRLQDEGASSFVKSWNDLMACIESKSAAMRKAS